MEVYGLCSAQETPSVYETPLLWPRERNCVQRMRDNLLQNPKTAGNRSFSLITLDNVVCILEVMQQIIFLEIRNLGMRV